MPYQYPKFSNLLNSIHSAFHSLHVCFLGLAVFSSSNINYFNPSLRGSIYDVIKIWRVVLTRCSILYLFNKQENGDPSGI